jgi:hypothetical protein
MKNLLYISLLLALAASSCIDRRMVKESMIWHGIPIKWMKTLLLASMHLLARAVI